MSAAVADVMSGLSDANELAAGGAPEESRVDERGQHGFTLNGVEPPHSLDLRGGQAEPRALEVLRADVAGDRADGRSSSHRGHDVTLKKCKLIQDAKHAPSKLAE